MIVIGYRCSKRLNLAKNILKLFIFKIGKHTTFNYQLSTQNISRPSTWSVSSHLKCLKFERFSKIMGKINLFLFDATNTEWKYEVLDGKIFFLKSNILNFISFNMENKINSFPDKLVLWHFWTSFIGYCKRSVPALFRFPSKVSIFQRALNYRPQWKFFCCY